MRTASLQEGVDQLNREGGGLYRLEIIRPDDLITLSEAIWSGDEGALTILQAALDSSFRIKRQARKNPVICLCCPRSVREPDAVLALLVPMTAAPTIAIASALCLRCSAEEPDKIIKRAGNAYTNAYPNLRNVEVTHPEGGRA
jgi:hypothetical protein